MRTFGRLGAKKYLVMGTGLVLVVLVVVGALLIARAGGGESEAGTQTNAVGSQTTVGGTENTGVSPTTTDTVSVSDGQASVVQPQTESVPLKQVDTPPAQTLAFVSADEYSADAQYSVTFVPYGTSGRPNTLVIQVLTSGPLGDIEKPFDFEGRNVLVDTSALSSAIGTGGTYSGVIRLVKQDSSLASGGVLAPTLTEAAAQ